MSIEILAAKRGLKLGVKLADIYRKWRTRLAWKRLARRDVSRLLNVLVLSLLAGGCTSLDSGYISLDERLFDGSQNPQKYLVPDGYEVKAFVRDGQGDRVDITGYTVEEEMIKTDAWTPRPLTIDARGRKSGDAVQEIIDLVREQKTTPVAGSGASAAEQSIIDAAKGAGVIP